MSVPLTEGADAPALAEPRARLAREWVVVAVLFALIAGWLALLGWAGVSLVNGLL